MLDVKLLLTAAVALPVLSVSAINSDATVLAWAVVCSAIGAYCLVAAEVVAMLMSERDPLPPLAKRFWWALVILRFTLGLPIGAFCALVYWVLYPDTHVYIVGAIGFAFGWSGIALKPLFDKVLHRKVERLGGLA